MDNIHKVYLFAFLNSIAFFGAVSIPFFLDWAKLSYAQIFTLEAVFMALIFLLEVPTGTVADKFGRKNSLFLGCLAWIAGLLVFGTVPDFFALLAGEALMALGVALMSGADRALLYDVLKEMRKAKDSKRFFSNYMIFGTLGMIIAFPVGSLIAGSSVLPYPQTLPLTFLLTALPIFLSALVIFSVKEPERKTPEENPVLLGIKGVGYFVRNKALRSLAIDMALISSTTFFIYWLYQPLLLNAEMSIKFLGFIAAAFNVLAIILLAKIKFIENLFGARKMLFLTALLPSFIFLALSVYSPLWLGLIGTFAIVGMRAMRQPLFDHYMNRYIKSRNRATVLSAISMMQTLVMVIFYPIIGFFADVSLGTAFFALGILTLLFAVFAKVDEKHLEK